MAKNWTAYEAAVALYGNNVDEIAEVGSRFPLFSRTVMAINDEFLLDILKSIPKVTARIVETGMKDCAEGIEPEQAEAENEEAKETEVKKESSYSGMTAKDLYKLCCERGISSKCKSRSKEALIDILTRFDNGEFAEELQEEEKKPNKVDKTESTKTRVRKKEEKSAPADDEWDDDEPEEEEKDPYAGKTAKELYKMCGERGIKTKPRQTAEAYVKLLKADDAKEKDEDTADDSDDDEWEI